MLLANSACNLFYVTGDGGFCGALILGLFALAGGVGAKSSKKFVGEACWDGLLTSWTAGLGYYFTAWTTDGWGGWIAIFYFCG